ncbi:murein transglycosylase A [Desulfobaculum bizertense]|uniref:murein transglycosylase A n=1 Tax=Desulfobaculum bizertense TaxID=376490 RepID=UPI001F335951|nr:murein transglycosylase A [Desulfobaculum bizertense]UIJ39039.1 murein transglycosylase A [Desulfobaculum bizertense]
MFRTLWLIVLTGVLFASGCAAPKKQPPLTLVEAPQDAGKLVKQLHPAGQHLSSWTDMQGAVDQSLAFVSVKPQARVALQNGAVRLTYGDLRETLVELKQVLPQLDRNPRLLKERFTWLRLTGGALMTGYYAPYIEASPKRTPEYRYPLYGVPQDLQTMDLAKYHPRWKGQKLVYRVENGEPVPYYSREEIDYEAKLRGRGLELAWAKDSVDVFFLQIQGSGLLKYPDGSMHHILYAGKNGRQYVSLGKVLIRRGLLDPKAVSMKSIREYLAAHPDEIPDLLSTNPSYVFFRVGDNGPYGAMGKLLTPRVSLATDPKVFPLGAVMAFDAKLPPEAPGAAPGEVTGIGLAQDTGGAIKGARLDWFCGSGTNVEYFAGHIKSPASVYMLVSKEVLKR